jgi:uncharacterized damage-inducible protein DinB
VIVLLRDLVAHKGYANAALLSAVATSPAAIADTDITDLLHHYLVANRFWALTVIGMEFRVDEEMSSPRTLDRLVHGFREVQALEEAWLERATDDDLARQIAGALVPGGRCTVAQAFMQVCLHSLGHRAQCAKLLRRHDTMPPTTDFILWLVDRPAARWP